MSQELGRVIPPAGTISLARGVPTPDVFPIAELADCARVAIERDGSVILNYGPPHGHEPLREWIAARHGVDAGRVLVTPGSLLALNLVIRCLLGAGGGAIVESPTYDRMLRILTAVGAEVLPVARSAGGLDLPSLESALRASRRPTLVYAMPSFHNPSGTSLVAGERRRLVELIAEHEATLLEDDPYGAIRFGGERPPGLLELALGLGCDDRVVASSSFSKTVAPGLRVGYVIAPPQLLPALEAAATDLYVSPPIAPQAQLLEFLRRGRFEPNLARVCTVLGERHDAMLEALAAELPDGCGWTSPGGGYFLWVDFPDTVDADTLLERARDRGVTFVAGSGFYLGAGGEHSARLAFSYPTAAEIREGVARLGALVREQLAAGAGARG